MLTDALKMPKSPGRWPSSGTSQKKNSTRREGLVAGRLGAKNSNPKQEITLPKVPSNDGPSKKELSS